MKDIKLKIQAFGIVMILFGNPIIHFFRDFVTILPKSSLLMPFFSCVFFLMILSFNHFKKIYTPNFNISVLSWCFLGYSFYLAFLSTNYVKYDIEILNYLFLGIFFFLLCGVSSDVHRVIMPIVVWVVLFDNLALIISFLLNPFQVLGQRAIISNQGWGEGAGNPTLYSFMAFTGLVASLLIIRKANFLLKIVAIATILSSIAVIFLTLIRATTIALGLGAIFFIVFNYKNIIRKSTLKNWYDFTIEKGNLILLVTSLVIVLGFIFFVDKKYFDILITYSEKTIQVFSGLIDSLLASDDIKKSSKADPSAASRVGLLNMAFEHIGRDPIKIIYGFGYRYLYVDVPIMQVFLEEGLIGLTIILMFHYFVIKNLILAGQFSNNNWITLLCYYYLILMVNSISRGEPYDPYFWNYFLAIARFLKPEYMILGQNKYHNSLIPA